MKMLGKTLSFAAVIAVIFALVFIPVVAFAQENPAVDTPTAEPPTPTESIKTPTPEPSTPIPTSTTPPTQAPSEPVPIPEPVTVVLFGTGLAALSAAAAARRKKE